MNNPPQHRAVEALIKLTRDFQGLGKRLNSFLEDRGKGLPDWPPYVLLPVAGWYAIASEQLAQGGQLNLEQARHVARLAAIGTWRYSQGIYRIAPELMQALLDSPMDGAIPTEVLHRLPEWCVYIETPGMTWHGMQLHGFWAHLEWDVNDGHEELRLLLDTDVLISYPLHLGGNLSAAIEGFLTESRKHGVVPEEVEKLVRADADGLSRLLSLVLYLCTETPEIDDSRSPGVSPHRPQPKRIKGGWRLFPPSAPRIWEVGQETASRLRQSVPVGKTTESTGRTVRAHLRRGHWHGYWTGPRKGGSPQKFILHWIHPLIAGGRI